MVKYARKRRSTKKSVTKTARAVVKASKSLMLRSVETKYLPAAQNTQLLNDSIYCYSPTQALNVGNTAITRVGDSILLQSFTITGLVNVNAAILNAKFRMMCGFTRSQVANTILATSILSTTDLFYSAPGQYNANKIVNTSIFTCLYDEVIDVNSNTTTGKDLRSFYNVLNLKMQKFDYAAQGGSLGKIKNFVVIVIPWSNTVAAGVDCAGINLTSVLKFKDP